MLLWSSVRTSGYVREPAHVKTSHMSLPSEQRWLYFEWSRTRRHGLMMNGGVLRSKTSFSPVLVLKTDVCLYDDTEGREDIMASWWGQP